MNKYKEFVRRLIRGFGYEVSRYKASALGQDPYQDIGFYLSGEETPVIFDVGANVGQTIQTVKTVMPTAQVHSFEPSPTTYSQLVANCHEMNWKDVSTWNLGIGSENGELPFIENSQSYMSSFLTPGELCSGNVTQTTSVDVVRLDSFVEEYDIPFIHALKSDTQGYDFEVLKGARQLLKEDRIGLVYFEFIFSNQYENIPAFQDVYQFLMDHNMKFVTFYKPHFQRHLVSWTDVLFINSTFYSKRFIPSLDSNSSKCGASFSPMKHAGN